MRTDVEPQSTKDGFTTRNDPCGSAVVERCRLPVTKLERSGGRLGAHDQYFRLVQLAEQFEIEVA
jgi:hypothetical protein